MPIFEFKCSKCETFFEIITNASSRDDADNKCPECGAIEFERVLSKTNYVMGSSSSNASSSVSKQERNCSQGSCTTYTVPGA